MAQQTIVIGSAANDGTGDPIRDAFDKCNDNFTELYTGLVGLLDFKGSTDCSANPNYPAASKGDFYVVSVAGKIGGASGVVVEVGDGYFATADNAGGTQASVGSSWTVIQANIVGGTISELDDIPDVNAPTPSDGDVLAWDNGAGEWVPVAQVGGGVGGTVPDGGTTGQVLTKQSGVDQDVDWQEPQISALDGAKVRKSAALTAQNLTGGAAVTWNAEDWDTGGYHDTGSLTDRLTVTNAGYYEVFGLLRLSSVTGGVWVTASANRYNSSDVVQEVINAGTISQAGTVCRVLVYGQAHFNAGDFARLFAQVQTDTSVDIDTDSHFGIRRIG